MTLLIAAIAMEFSVMLVAVAPPRILNASPLLFAFGLAVAPSHLPPNRTADDRSGLHHIATTVSLGLMLLLGLPYLAFSNLFAPFPDILAFYALYTLLLAGTIRLSLRRDWWVAAMPFVTAGLFLLVVQLGVTYRGWSG